MNRGKTLPRELSLGCSSLVHELTRVSARTASFLGTSVRALSPLPVFTLEEKIESIDSPLPDEDIASSFLSSFEQLCRVGCVHLSITYAYARAYDSGNKMFNGVSLEEDGKLVRVVEKLKGLDTST